ncbi:MAG: tRNA epoxyqueuosine(34) reductase QueG [Saprospiraceae bacterium]|nr:tRNA epoxyqueuosine(34) reductase QueG [Saprospiraceae bacterium]
MEDSIKHKSQWIKQQALSMGFEAVGFTQAMHLKEEELRLKKWLEKGYHGKMGYMENHFEKRVDPRLLMEGCKSVICFMYNYYTSETQDESVAQISIYAHGRDYHKVIKKKLKELAKSIEAEFENFKYRSFVDSAPLLERDWAKRSGLGWIGKNTLLISPQKGSYFFLAEMLVDFELEYDEPIKDYCGTCTRCIDACPTDAILDEGYVMDGSKCISYLTIELKEDIPEEFKGKMENYIFGCDICQDVCPWNRFSKEHNEEEFRGHPDFYKLSNDDFQNMDEDQFNKLFGNSAVKRTGFTRLKNNIKFLNKD